MKVHEKQDKKLLVVLKEKVKEYMTHESPDASEPLKPTLSTSLMVSVI